MSLPEESVAIFVNMAGIFVGVVLGFIIMADVKNLCHKASEAIQLLAEIREDQKENGGKLPPPVWDSTLVTPKPDKLADGDDSR